MDLSMNKGNRRNIATKNICMESNLKLSQNAIIEHVPSKPDIFNTDSNFNVYKLDESFQVKRFKNSLVNKNPEFSITDLSKDGRKEVFPNSLTIDPLSTQTHKKYITEIELNTLMNENDTVFKEPKYLPQNFKDPVFCSYSDSLNNGIIMKNQNSGSSNSFNSSFNKNLGLNHGYLNNLNDNDVFVLLKQKQLEAKVQQLKIEEEKIIKQEQEAHLKTCQALQEQEAALLEKEKSLKIRGLAAQKKIEEAHKIRENSRRLSTSAEGFSSYINESPKHIRSQSSQLDPSDVKYYISDNINKRKFESVVPNVMVIKEMSPHSTNGSLKHFINMPNGNTFYLHSSNQPSHTIEKEPPRKRRVLDLYGVKPSINPSKILHTYSRTVPKKFNGTSIKSEGAISPLLTRHSNMLVMKQERPKSSCKNITEILISDDGTITVSESPKSDNYSRPSSKLSHSQLLMPDNLEIKLPIINHCSDNNNYSTTKIDIETNNDLISKTKVNIETTDISGNDQEIAFTEKVQKLTTGLHLPNQTAGISEEFSVFTGKKEVTLNELSENINYENLGKIYEDVLNEPCHSVENKLTNGLQDNSDIDFDINESSCPLNIDLSNNNNNKEKENNNNSNNFSHAYTSTCNENPSYDLNEISVDPNFKDLVYKMENSSNQFNHSVEVDSSDKVQIQNLELSPSKRHDDNNDTLCYNQDSNIQSAEIDIEEFSNSEDATDNYHDENLEVNDYWNQSFSKINEGEGCFDQLSKETVCQIQNVKEQLVSEPQVETGPDCSRIVEGNAQHLEVNYDKETVVMDSTEANINTATCKSIENSDTKSSEIEHLSERINKEECNSNQIEDEAPSIVNELNIDGASIIDVNDISFDKPLEDFQEEYLSDLDNIADEESDVEDFTSTIFKERDKSFQPLKWTLEFRQKHYSDKLYPELRCHHMQWIEIDDLEEHMFLSNCDASPLFKLQSKYSKDISWSRIRLFTGKQLGSGKLIFIGGPIKCSAWCPIPVVPELQYIALSSVCNPDVEVSMSKSENHRGLIQIWHCGKLNEADIPSLALCIAHEYGVVWSLAWCPSGIYEKAEVTNDSALNRLGLLSAAFSDGVIRVYLIPHPHQLKRKKIFFKKVPEFSLIHHNYENFDIQCVKICWSPYKGHSLIAGSFTNGMVCIWNLTCSSSVLRSSDTEGIKLYPINSISAHSGICSAVSFYPKTNGQHIATGGSDRTIKFWDLSEPEHPLTVIKKGCVTDSIWIPHWSGAIFSFDDAFSICKTSTTFRGNGFYGNSVKSIAGTNATTWNISASDWLNAVVQADEAGEVLVSYPKKLNCDIVSECHSSKYNFPVFSVRLEKIKDIQLQDEDQGAKNEGSNCVKKRRGRKRKKKPELVQQYDEEPVTYSSAIETYGIKFYDDENFSKPNVSHLSTKKTSEPMPPGPITVYPLMGASSVTWNNNLGTHTWIFIGLNSGFGRLIQLPVCKEK
ncbi:UNVERIFIED_CONTAM: hypothetical protein RMT77_018507 [Armadillidium vulgare]